jgi:hypothetical protein
VKGWDAVGDDERRELSAASPQVGSDIVVAEVFVARGGSFAWNGAMLAAASFEVSGGIVSDSEYAAASVTLGAGCLVNRRAKTRSRGGPSGARIGVKCSGGTDVGGKDGARELGTAEVCVCVGAVEAGIPALAVMAGPPP